MGDLSRPDPVVHNPPSAKQCKPVDPEHRDTGLTAIDTRQSRTIDEEALAALQDEPLSKHVVGPQGIRVP